MKEAFKWPLRQDEGCRFQKSPTAHCPTYREYGDLSIGDVFSPALVTALVPLYFIHFKYNLFSAWQSGGAALRKMKGPTSAWDTAAWVRVTMWRAAATWHVTERDTGHGGVNHPLGPRPGAAKCGVRSRLVWEPGTVSIMTATLLDSWSHLERHTKQSPE